MSSDEERLAALMADLLGAQLKRVLAGPVDWEEEDKILAEAVWPMLNASAQKEARKVMRLRAGYGLFERVEEWARSYAYELIGGINEHTRVRLAAALQIFISTPEPREDLIGRVAGIFGPERAEVIAVTETTRAYAQGGRMAADELRAAGFEILDIWRTANDELSRDCELCGPLEGKVRGDGWTEDPPAHPNCRCGVAHEIA